ncbi:MAG: hypothetical protein WC004_00160 [Candidatus Absconditabacterales bacterium]
MKKLVLQSILIACFASLLCGSQAFAATTNYIVKISSNPAMLNEALDLTIEAVDKNGVVDKSYVGDALINVKGLEEGEYTLPNGGIVNFTPNNQGSVRFSKGLIFKKTGKNIVISAEDILDEKTIGSITVEVKDPNSSAGLKKVTIMSPTVNGSETNKNVNILGSSTELPNSPLKVLVDGKVNTSSSTNAQGEFSVFANDLSEGQHTVQVVIYDSSDKVLAQSDEITFSVSNLSNELYKSIKVDPGTTVSENDKITVTLTTAPEVTTAELTLLGNSYFMEKTTSGIFEKKFKFNQANSRIQIDAKLTANGNSKTYTNIEGIVVLASSGPVNTGAASTVEDTSASVTDNTPPVSNIKITSIKSIYQPDTKKYLVSWTTEGEPARYLVLISSNKDTIQSAPELIQTTTDKQILINPPRDTTYYLQVIAADANSNPVGEASEIVSLKAPDEYQGSAPTCIVDAIKLDSVVIAGRHYLIWNKQNGVERYIVYRSDTLGNDVSQMTKLGETSENRFEFSFNGNAKAPEYKYFAVQGMCSDGQSTNVASSTKVQVGPLNVAIYLALMMGFTYISYLIITNKQDI